MRTISPGDSVTGASATDIRIPVSPTSAILSTVHGLSGSRISPKYFESAAAHDTGYFSTFPFPIVLRWSCSISPFVSPTAPGKVYESASSSPLNSWDSSNPGRSRIASREPLDTCSRTSKSSRSPETSSSRTIRTPPEDSQTRRTILFSPARTAWASGELVEKTGTGGNEGWLSSRYRSSGSGRPPPPAEDFGGLPLAPGRRCHAPHLVPLPAGPPAPSGEARSRIDRPVKWRPTRRSPGSSFFPLSPRSKEMDPPRQIDAPRAKRMAPQDPPNPAKHPQDRPGLADRAYHIVGATRIGAAGVPPGWGDRPLVEFQGADGEISCPHREGSSFRPHRRKIAGRSSAETAASPGLEGAFFATMAVRLPRGNTSYLWIR